jgi:hypothetical protein
MNATKDILDWIDVGTVSAERDPYLANYFYDGGAAQSVVESGRHFLILGRKGAGKTAVFEFLKTKPDTVFKSTDLLVPLSLVDYSWNAHALLAKPEKTASMVQRDSWRFVFAVETIRQLIQSAQSNHTPLSASILEAAKILEKIFSKPIPSWTELLGGKLFRLAKLKLPSGGLGQLQNEIKIDAGEVSFENLQANTDLRSQLSHNAERLTAYFEEAVKKDTGSNRIFLIFDRLDEAWTTESIDVCKQIVVGLLQASEYALSKYSGRVRPIVFLREDIFPTLSVNDKNKLRQDCSSTLMWSAGSLNEMILKRIKFYAQRAGVNIAEDIDSLFDRAEMRNRTSPSRYILFRTMMRPRDLVSYYRAMFESMRDNSKDELGDFHSDSNRTQLQSDAIYDAEPKFGEYLYSEIRDEWETQMPQIQSYLDAFVNIGTAVFSPTSYDTELKKIDINLTPIQLQDTLRFLYENSIIGFKVGASNIWRFRSTTPGQAFVFANEYRVHNGLLKRLNLREPYKAQEGSTE